MFTINNPSEETLQSLIRQASGNPCEVPPYWWTDNLHLLAYQLEVGERESTLHIQGFIYFKKKLRRASVASVFGSESAHLEVARGTDVQCLDYVTKEATRANLSNLFHTGPWVYGKCPSRGKASMTKVLWDGIKAGKSAFELVEADPTLLLHEKALRFAIQLKRRNASQQFRKVQVEVLIGPPGSGKTYRAVCESGNGECPDGCDPYEFGMRTCYVLTIHQGSRCVWFDGYEIRDDASSIVIDDFAPNHVDYAYFLRLLDGHQFEGQIKGGFTAACYTKIFITSNVPVEAWYPERSNIDALLRRINRIRTFNPDGTILTTVLDPGPARSGLFVVPGSATTVGNNDDEAGPSVPSSSSSTVVAPSPRMLSASEALSNLSISPLNSAFVRDFEPIRPRLSPVREFPFLDVESAPSDSEASVSATLSYDVSLSENNDDDYCEWLASPSPSSVFLPVWQDETEGEL